MALYAPFRDAGWSSLVARRAHNPKVVGSNPAPATILKRSAFLSSFFLHLSVIYSPLVVRLSDSGIDFSAFPRHTLPSGQSRETQQNLINKAPGMLLNLTAGFSNVPGAVHHRQDSSPSKGCQERSAGRDLFWLSKSGLGTTDRIFSRAWPLSLKTSSELPSPSTS